MFDSNRQIKARESVAKWFGVATDDSQVTQNNLKWHRRSMVVHGQKQPPYVDSAVIKCLL